MKKSKIAYIFIILFFSQYCAAEDKIGKHLDSFEPSYFMWVSDEDDSYARFKVSIKYPLSECKNVNDAAACDNVDGLWYFAYTGTYDFFVETSNSGRKSSPVVSRLQNPGLFYKWKFNKDNSNALKAASVGWFHESNGQQISDPDIFKNTAYASDYVSRGWDYLGVDLKFKNKLFDSINDIHTYYLRLKYFCDCQALGAADREDDVSIFGITDNVKIEDYDGFRFLIRNEISKSFNYALSVRTGTRNADAFSNLSYQAELTFDVGGWPISLMYFDGYGKNISTYHMKSKYWGIGLKMW